MKPYVRLPHQPTRAAEGRIPYWLKELIAGIGFCLIAFALGLIAVAW